MIKALANSKFGQVLIAGVAANMAISPAYAQSANENVTQLAATELNPYSFPMTQGMNFFKEDIRPDNFSSEFSDRLMGRASRNGIMIGVFGGDESMHRQIELGVGDAHQRGLPVAMAITNDTDSNPSDAVIKVFEGGSVIYTAPALSFADDLRPTVLQMVQEAEQSREVRLARLSYNAQ